MSEKKKTQIRIENTDASLDLSEINGPGEVGEVLAALDQLSRRVSSPVVKACLEEAREDIAFLTEGDGGVVQETGLKAAA